MSNRRENDLYTSNQTQSLIDVLMHENRLSRRIAGTVLEPCAGPLKMANALMCWDAIDDIVTNDIDPQHPTDYHLDATERSFWDWFPPVDWVITNPPFNVAHKILPLAMENAKRGVAFLMRLSYAEPCQKGQVRGLWLKDHADHQVWQCVLNPRPKFRYGEINPNTGKEYGTDNVTVAWFVWNKDWSWRRLGINSPFAYGMNWNGGVA